MAAAGVDMFFFSVMNALFSYLLLLFADGTLHCTKYNVHHKEQQKQKATVCIIEYLTDPGCGGPFGQKKLGN